jgi:hypothetical protein
MSRSAADEQGISANGVPSVGDVMISVLEDEISVKVPLTKFLIRSYFIHGGFERRYNTLNLLKKSISGMCFLK